MKVIKRKDMFSQRNLALIERMIESKESRNWRFNWSHRKVNITTQRKSRIANSSECQAHQLEAQITATKMTRTWNRIKSLYRKAVFLNYRRTSKLIQKVTMKLKTLKWTNYASSCRTFSKSRTHKQKMNSCLFRKSLILIKSSLTSQLVLVKSFKVSAE